MIRGDPLHVRLRGILSMFGSGVEINVETRLKRVDSG
jgi:hypothetical protein